MGSDDTGKKYPCVCGKVFRRQLALERHVDVHHSSKSVAHKCEMCGKTFGSRNALTMHRTIHVNSTAQSRSPFLNGDASVVPITDNESSVKCEPDLSDAIEEFHQMDSPNSLVHVSLSQEENEKSLVKTCKSIEAGATDRLTCQTYQLNEEEMTPRIKFVTDSRVPMSAPSETKHDRSSSVEHIPKSVVVSFLNQSPSSNVFGANDETEQSIDFSDMVAEEVVSESLVHISDQLPRNFATLNWSKPEQYSNLAAAYDPTSSDNLEAKCLHQDVAPSPESTHVHASELLQRRVNKVKPETRKTQEKPRQSRGSDGVELIDEYECDSGQKEATTRQLTSNRTPFICGICNKSFDSEKYLSMHMPLHKPYLDTSADDVKTCPEFPELSGMQGQPGSRQKKTTTSTEMQHWTCQYCDKLFMQNSNYKNHMRTHSDERPFVCEICNIGFKERYHLKKHVLFKHTTDLKEKCRVCGKCFKDSTAVRAHERIHSEIRPYSCPLCGKTFKTSECLWHHENRSKTCGKSAMMRGDGSPLTTPVASMALQNASEVASMRRTRKPRQGGGASKLRTPRRSSITSVPNGSDSTKQHGDVTDYKMLNEMKASIMAIKAEPECDLFDSSLPTFFHSDQELENILEILDSGANKKGSNADETGSDLTDSDNGHIAKDREDFSAKYKGLECTKCVKKFSSTATFEKHMVMHNEERPYRCTLCDNGFKLKVHLKKHHLYRHSNEYPCECSICGKRFKDSSAVRLHEKIHSSDRPFRCHCGKGFKTRENLWGHRNRGPCEKTQDFITNNISLYQTTEFGAILGVPFTNGQGLIASSNLAATPITSSSFINNVGRTIDLSQIKFQTNMQPVFLKTAHGGIHVPHSMQFVPSCVISTPQVFTEETSRHLRVATLKIIKTRSSDALTQQTAALPTAIVTPLLRDGTTLSSGTHLSIQPANKSTLKTVAILPNNLISKTTSSPLQSNIASTADSSLDLTSHRTTSSTSSPIISGIEILKNIVPSAAEKCPTVQKFLEMGLTTVKKHPGLINPLLGNPMVLESRYDSSTKSITPKRRKLNGAGDDNSLTEYEDNKASRSRHEDEANILCAGVIGLIDQESQDSSSLPYIDPLFTNNSQSSQLSVYPGMGDYDDMKYDPNDPTLNIGDVYWGDCDNTLSSGWLLENEDLFSDLSPTSTFGTLQIPT